MTSGDDPLTSRPPTAPTAPAKRSRWADDELPERPPSPIDSRPEPEAGDAIEGQGIINASFAGTGALAAASLAGVLSPDSLAGVTAVVSTILFVLGMVAMLWGYAVGVARSRQELITLSGLFFLSGTAPKVVRFRLRLAFALQVVIAVTAAAVQPYTAVAFAVLAPMFGLGLLALWGARHGVFFPRPDDGGAAP